MNLLKIVFLMAMYVTALSAKAQSISGSLQQSSAVTAAPFVITSTSVDVSTNGIHTCKQEVKGVETDAYNFIAGEPMTLALEEQIGNVRNAVPELENASDEIIVITMLESINS